MTTKSETLKTSEADHQKVVIEWARLHEKKWPCLKFLYACPNEGKHKVQYRVHQKAMGVKSGVPDIFLPYPKRSRFTVYDESGYVVDGALAWAGLYLELKTIGGKVSDSQKEFLDYLRNAGYRAEVCWNADMAIRAIEGYLG